MKALFKLKKGLPLAVSTAAALAMTDEETGKFFWGFGRKKKISEDRTVTYIWGNGHYQSKPGKAMQFTNFAPKKIKTFNGRDQPYLKKVYFGRCFEAGIDVDGNVLVWPLNPLHSTPEKSVNYQTRKGVQLLDKDGDNVQIAFSKRFLWVLKEDGNVYQYNVEAKFDEETRTIRQPVIKNQRRVIKSLSNIKQIACGEDHFVALDKKGLVYTMGDDTLGQCGLGNFGRSSGGPFYERRVRNPEAIQDLPTILKISAGNDHTLAVSQEGDCYGWGSNNQLQLSHEKEFSRLEDPLLASFSPIRIDQNLSSNTVTDIAAGGEYSIFVTENRKNKETEVFGTGFNVFGELGIGTNKHINDVELIDGLSNYKIYDEGQPKNLKVNQVSCGSNHCMVLFNLGAILEWGANEYGQLGNKKRTFATKPILLAKFQNENVKNITCGYQSSAVIIEEPPSKKASGSKSK